LTDWEQILADDLLDHMAPYVRLGHKSSLLKETADRSVVDAYSAAYRRMLRTIYDNLRPAEPVFLDGMICQPFYFGDEPEVEWLGPDCKEHLQKLIYDEAIASLRTIRVVRLYHENVIFIVKPDRLRY